VANVGPQLIAFDPMHAKPDHHAVVQFGKTTSNRLAVGIGLI
jgi:hypothetical protein